MAGKRPRQIQRTTSMSQLGTAVSFSHGRSGGFPPRGQSYPPQQELGHITMVPCPELGEVTVPPLAMDEECNSMLIDGSAEESLCTSRTPWSEADTLPSSNRVPVIDGDVFSCFRAHQWNLSAPVYGKDREITHLCHGVFDMSGSVHPAHFLDICYLCSKLLGHGRDVFIYREVIEPSAVWSVGICKSWQMKGGRKLLLQDQRRGQLLSCKWVMLLVQALWKRLWLPEELAGE